MASKNSNLYLASYADVLRLVTRSPQRVTSLRTFAWEANLYHARYEKKMWKRIPHPMQQHETPKK